MRLALLCAALLLPIPLLLAQTRTDVEDLVEASIRDELMGRQAPNLPSVPDILIPDIVIATARVDVKDLTARAEKGDVAAQRTLGNLYYDGKAGGGQDYKNAFAWFLRASEQGDPIAQNNLGVMFGDGKHWPQDFERAYYWINRSANSGLPKAQFHLGILYIQGWGIPVDQVRGLGLIQIAADAHDPHAELYLARYHLVKRQIDKAYEYASRSYAHARLAKALSIRNITQSYLQATGATEVLTRVQRLTSREEERGSHDNRVTVVGPAVTGKP